MWPQNLLYEFANRAENKPSLDARLRVVLNFEHFSGRYCIIDDVEGGPRIKVYVATTLSPNALRMKNRDLLDRQVVQVSPVEGDIGGEFLVTFSGKNDVAYLLRELEACRISGDRNASELLGLIEAKLKAQSRQPVPVPKPAFKLIQGGLAGKPANH